MARHWILQATPDRYNIDGRLQLGRKGLTWTMRQHAADVSEGDTVWIWRSRGKRGRTAGVVARGELGPLVDGIDPDPFDIGDIERSAHPVRRIEAVEVLRPGNTLDRETLRANEALQDLRILKSPQGTVFGLSFEQGEELDLAWWRRVEAQEALPEEEATEFDFGTLRARRDACFRDPAFWAELDANGRQRAEALPEMRGLVQRFLDGAASLEEFREEFDRRTRTAPWSGFGFGGMSVAMALNKLTKHAPDLLAMEAVVRDTARSPSDEGDALGKLERFLAFVEGLIEGELVTRGQVQPARLHVLMSALWHIQDPALWPVRYDSVRQRLFLCGYEQPADFPRRYVAYRRAERAARAALGLPGAVLHVVADFEGRIAVESSAGTPAPRAWIIGVGHAEKDEFWRWFQTDGVIAMGGAIGDLRDYPDRDGIHEALRQLPHTSDNPRNDSLGCERFVRLMQPGDRVYARQGRSRLLGMGRITGEYEHRPDARYEHIRPVAWEWVGDIELKDKPFAIHTVVELTKFTDFLARLETLVAEAQAGPEAPTPVAATYTVDDALDGLFLDRSELEAHLARLRRRRNLVLQGPPGTGKTFLAARLARLLTGDRTDARVRRVQFHQSTTYEHFIEGFRPTAEGGFTLGDGPFKKLCDAAREDAERPYVMVIDEINRGNLSRIFGELLMLIEADKRRAEWAVELAYSGEPFWVPDNVYLVGTMNTADRSLALVDYALRRRFAFATVAPAWGRSQLRTHLDAAIDDPGVVAPLVEAMRKLNQRIHADSDLGPGFKVGHSWFCGGPDLDAEESASAWATDVIETEIAPLLEEYWFDRPDALESALALLRGDGA